MSEEIKDWNEGFRRLAHLAPNDISGSASGAERGERTEPMTAEQIAAKIAELTETLRPHREWGGCPMTGEEDCCDTLVIELRLLRQLSASESERERVSRELDEERANRTMAEKEAAWARESATNAGREAASLRAALDREISVALEFAEDALDSDAPDVPKALGFVREALGEWRRTTGRTTTDAARCEGCGAPATTQDSDGVKLCAACYAVTPVVDDAAAPSPDGGEPT